MLDPVVLGYTFVAETDPLQLRQMSLANLSQILEKLY